MAEKGRILLAEDEDLLRNIVKGLLEQEGYEVIEARDGSEALNLFSKDPNIDLAILDIMMPYIDGLEVCKIIKKELNIPVMIMTAKSTDEDQLISLKSGADDYMSKPVNFGIFIERIRILLKNKANSSKKITYGDLSLDLERMEASIGDNVLDLTLKEYNILLLLLSNKGKPFSREEIINNVWGDASKISDERIVDAHIKNIRLKLGDYSDSLATVRGYGYKFE